MYTQQEAKPRQYFIAGTDTDVGKTFVACALLSKANSEGYSTVALKPVAAGCVASDAGLRNEDALALMASASIKLSYEAVNPIALLPPIAPHIAAAEIGLKLNVDGLLQKSQAVLQAGADFTLVEGAGGWHVPLDGQAYLSDYAVALGMPVILVIGLKLGCLNHALLTVQAIEASGLRLAGWVANQVGFEPMSRQEASIETLKQCLNAPCVGILPHTMGAKPALTAKHLDISRLM